MRIIENSIWIISLMTLFVVGCNSNTKESKSQNNKKLVSLKKEKVKLNEELTQLKVKLEVVNTKIAELEPVSNSKLARVSTIVTSYNIFEHFVELQSDIQTDQNIIISPQYSGVLKLLVNEGQRVRAGQVIGKVSDGGLSDQLAQVKIQAELAKSAYEKQDRLWKQNIGSEMQYLQAKSSYEAAIKQVAMVRNQLGRTTIKAPFSGIIDKVITENGSTVAPGIGIVQLVNMGRMKVEADVPEKLISSIKKGARAKVYIPSIDRAISSKVSKVGNIINPNNRTFSIEVPIPNADYSIKPNLSAKIQINDYTKLSAILIPQSIVSENANGEQFVYLLTNIKNNKGKAKRVIIETGKTQQGMIEVTSGLDSDMVLIQEGARTVKEGQTVEIVNSNK